jgi:cytochrome P450
MPYLEAVVLEALRLHPPAYMVGRCASRPAQLAGYSLPAGTTVLVSPYLLQRDARLWQQEEQFRPERWLELFEQQQQQARQKAELQQVQQLEAGALGQRRGAPQATQAQQQQEQRQELSHQGQAALAALEAAQQQQQQQQQAPGLWPSLLKDMGPNGAYIPFGSGPRNCIGTGFAMMEALLVLAAVLQQVELRPAPGASFPRPAPILTLRPDKVELQLVPRGAGRP